MDALMTNAGIERTIPLAFFKLYDGVPNDNDLWQSMLGSVWSANVMFKAAHVQFYPAVVKDCHGDGTFANVANDGPVSYDAVDDELTCAAPMRASGEGRALANTLSVTSRTCWTSTEMESATSHGGRHRAPSTTASGLCFVATPARRSIQRRKSLSLASESSATCPFQQTTTAMD
jgi:hypothetical protein